jgi:hypothetical protein
MTLKILPHGRLQEWVAEERGYFAAEGLEYTFLPEGDYGIHATRRDDAGEVKTGAFETFGAGRDGADVSCACHWATNAAASGGAGQLVTSAYSVAPCAIMVPPESPPRPVRNRIPACPVSHTRKLSIAECISNACLATSLYEELSAELPEDASARLREHAALLGCSILRRPSPPPSVGGHQHPAGGHEEGIVAITHKE